MLDLQFERRPSADLGAFTSLRLPNSACFLTTVLHIGTHPVWRTRLGRAFTH